MNYEKKYNDALLRAKKLKENPIEVFYEYNPKDGDTICDYIFPELKESEDERIRKALINGFKDYKGWDEEWFDGITVRDAIAWLEKQDDQKKSYDTCNSSMMDNKKSPYSEKRDFGYFEENQSEPNLDNKVEPIFNIGNWITNGNYTWKIIEVKPLDYILQSQDGNIVDDTISHVNEQFHSFTIEDAKPGDILAIEPIDGYQYPFVAIYKERGLDYFNSYCFIGFSGIFYGGECGHRTNVHPATKEQCDILFEKMKEAGYEWDAEKKELKKIENRPMLSDFFKAEYERGKADAISEVQKEWSEEDARICQCLIEDQEEALSKVEVISNLNKMYHERIDWLKFLKDRIQPKHEWGEEDECCMTECINAIATKDGWSFEEKRKTKHWLELLKHRIGKI